MALITKKEASERLGIGVRTLEGFIGRGQLPVYRIGPRLVRIEEADLEAFLEARRCQQAQPKPVEIRRPCLYVPGMKVV